MKYPFKVGDIVRCDEKISIMYRKIGIVKTNGGSFMSVLYPGRIEPWIHFENRVVLAEEFIIDKLLEKYK